MMPSTSSSEPVVTVDYQTYRTTCDSCARSKVRCTKETQCRRCVSHGVVCIYRPSRRSKRPMGDDNVHELPWALFQDPSSDSNERQTADALGLEAVSSHRESTTRAPSRPKHNCSTCYMTSNTNASSNPARNVTDASPSSDPQSMLIDWESTAPWAALLGNDNSLGSSSDIATDPCLMTNHVDNVLVTSEEATGLKSPIKSMVTRDGIGTGCARIGAALLTCLESPGAPLVMEYRVAPEMPNMLRRDVGAMVRINREALDQVQLVLICPCGAPSNHTPIVTVALSMILSWYEACLQSVNANDGQSEGSSTLDLPPSSSTRCSISGASKDADLAALEKTGHRHVDPESAGKRKEDLVCIPPIQIGGLRLDATHARQVIAQIVIDDLKELERMVDRLSYSGSAAVRQDWEAQLQVSMTAALRTRVKKVLQRAGGKNGDEA